MSDVSELHWMFDALQRIEVGLVIIDRDYRIHTWNGFMEHHSGINPSHAREQQLFELIPALPQAWLTRKLESVFTLNTPVYLSWEQRPQLFPFKAPRPFTSAAQQMYQNISLLPLCGLDGSCDHLCIAVYDVTDQALGQQSLENANHKLERLSQTDRLTGLYNRGHWEQVFRLEFKRTQRYATPASLVMLDIDHFKRINDNYGHPAGDEVIRTLATTLDEADRETDFTGRYGGEEFAVLLSNTDANGALHFCERVRQAIEMLTVEHNGHRINFTISLGVAEFDTTTQSPEIWLSRADQALYQAKESGRNRAVAYNPADEGQ